MNRREFLRQRREIEHGSQYRSDADRRLIKLQSKYIRALESELKKQVSMAEKQAKSIYSLVGHFATTPAEMNALFDSDPVLFGLAVGGIASTVPNQKKDS